MSGRVILVGTPLGNLEDMSPRAIAALENANVVASEDTRRTGGLCRHFGITTPRIRFDEHTEGERVDELLERVAGGETVAVVSDAGMPIIHDPGLLLVRKAIEQNLTVTAAPGPTAPTLALVLSGFAAVPWAFFGFPPAKQGGREQFAQQIADWPHTAVCFLSPHRGSAELAALAEACRDRPAVLARELTKIHEALLRGTVGDLAQMVVEDSPKGEWTLVVGPDSPPEVPPVEALAEIARRRAENDNTSLKQAAFAVAREYGAPRRSVYRFILADTDT